TTKQINTLQTQSIITAEILRKIEKQQENLSNLQKINHELQERVNYCEKLEKELIQKSTELEEIRKKKKGFGKDSLSEWEKDQLGQLPEDIEGLGKQLFEARKFLKDEGVT